MEPKISGSSKGLRFPYEPSLSQPVKRKEDLIPRIVPAELNAPVPTPVKTKKIQPVSSAAAASNLDPSKEEAPGSTPPLTIHQHRLNLQPLQPLSKLLSPNEKTRES